MTRMGAAMMMGEVIRSGGLEGLTEAEGLRGGGHLGERG